MRQKEYIDVVVVGYGHIGRRHSFMVNQHPKTRLVGVCDIFSTSLVADLGKENTPYLGTFEEFISNPIDCDLVCICTPNGLHATQSVQALTKGVHVLCEKPMAITLADATTIEQACATSKKNFYCVTQNRYSPVSQWLKNVLKDGKLGDIRWVQVNALWNRDQRYYTGNWKGTAQMDGGTLFTQFSHFVDTLIWCLGDLEVTQSTLLNLTHANVIDFEDTGSFQYRFQQQGFGNFQYSTSVWQKNLESSIVIIGEKGTIKIGGQYMEDLLFCEGKFISTPELKPHTIPYQSDIYKGSSFHHYLLLDDVIKDIQGISSENLSTLQQSKQVVKTIQEVYQKSEFFKDKF